MTARQNRSGRVLDGVGEGYRGDGCRFRVLGEDAGL